VSSNGIRKEDIDTPALLVDLDLMEKNLLTMASFFRGKKARLRVHTKVHRTPALAHRQIEAGARGICCQKLGEAEVMASAGIEDIIVTNQIVTPDKINRLVNLAKRTDICVPVDNPRNADDLSRAALKEGARLKVLVDIDTGAQRCGVEPGESALKLAQHINALRGLRLRGLMSFEGHLSWMEPRDQRRKECEKLEHLLTDTKMLMENRGIAVEEICTGTTGTYDVTGNYPGVTEAKAGIYLLMDNNYHQHVPEFDCALSILCTVISVPSSERIVTDAGLTSISNAYGDPVVRDGLGLKVQELHAENTVLKVERGPRIGIGDKIELIPSYLDGTVNMHESLYAIRNTKVEATWSISGRGRSR
jgi:D-serine deaminase-like pyridoxal phosphate-dependent protein